MNIIVQKFGGTSTRSRESRSTMYNNIIREINNGNKVVAVVSAMGRYDDPYMLIYSTTKIVQNLSLCCDKDKNLLPVYCNLSLVSDTPPSVILVSIQ